MSILVNNSGVWLEVIQPYVNNAGTWRTIITQSVNDASTWRTVFPVVGEYWIWGTNQAGAAGNNSFTVPICTPITTFAGGNNWTQIGVGGNNFTTAIKSDGTLWTWGSNTSGRLGNNSTRAVSTPITTFAGGTNWTRVAGGFISIAAIKTDGTLWTWGTNTNGILGNNTLLNRGSTPTTTFAGGTNWREVSAASHCAAIKTDGTLWLWGAGTALGHNSTAARSFPVTTFAGGTNWRQVACGGQHTAAIKSDGTLWTWGSNNFGQLGTNVPAAAASTPVTTFAGGTNWKQVACGNLHMAAIKTDGTLWIWGWNSDGQLGTNKGGVGNITCTPVTTFAGGTNWRQVSCFANFTSTIKTDGTLWTWGAGPVGDNTPISTNRSTPVTTFAGGTNWKRVNGVAVIR